MGIYTIKPLFQKVLSPITNLLIKYKIHPNTINLFGLLSSVGMAICIYFSTIIPLLLFAVPILAFLRTASNALDGLVSRALGVNSPFGEVLNEFLDRVSDSLIFLSVTFLLTTDWLLGSATVIAILLNSYLSIVSKAAGGKRQYGGIMGKADRMIYIGFVAILAYFYDLPLLWNYFMWFILIGTLITMGQRFLTITRELK